MRDTALDTLNETFARYVETPTKQEQDALMGAVENYREKWIEARAVQGLKPKSHAAKSSEAHSRYKRILSVQGKQPDGTELTLALQSRTKTRLGHTLFVVSWRSRLGPGGPNRRFYVSNDEPWSMSASLALDMLEELEGSGGLDEKYFDLDRRPDFDVISSQLAIDPERSVILEEITMLGESWGESPFFTVLKDPNGDWRKIMLVNRKTGQATFRSTTTDTTYMPRKTLRPGAEFFLDNSMQDTNVQQAQIFLAELRKIVPVLQTN